jgi:hypothetical protein
MRVLIKIILTIVLLMVGTLIIEGIKNAMGTKASTGGVGPIIIYPALLAGIYAIWKWKPTIESDTDNYEDLNKD